ncbi:hypothetical protein GTZ99_13835 [Novosphingobium sp. FSY-8]|uniref:Meckel syndrome type 1 protein n=1 Tax=Novosphingobium ovatum TaxID=1908523 RepID=A0ABW9XGK8_9SPHN|nr:hypothetical protein [Novosphingobium ovatum]NBC37631.1 hypothetical protein [Novosphingobium ovatum]
MASHHPYARDKSRRQGWTALIRHPFFDAGVAVWFGATFALSTLAIRGELLEQAVLSSHLDLVLTVATPPLGLKARLLLALAFGAVGALIGWLAAKALARQASQPTTHYTAPGGYAAQGTYAPAQPVAAAARDSWPRQREPQSEPAPRAPIRAHEELGADGFDAPMFDQPFAAPQALAPAMTPAMAAPAPTEAIPSPLWQAAIGATAMSAPPPLAPAMPLATAAPTPPVEPVAPTLRPVFTAPEAVATPVPAPLADTAPVAELLRAPVIDVLTPAPQAIEAAPVEAPVMIETPADAAPLTTVDAPDASGGERAPSALSAGFPVASGPTAAEHIASAPLDELSHVELLERLAIAMERRRERQLAKARPLPGLPANDVPDPSEVDDACPMSVDRIDLALNALAPAASDAALREALAGLQDIK